MTNDNDQAQETAIRLECLKIAVAQREFYEDALIAARAYSDFALGKADAAIVCNANALNALLYPKGRPREGLRRCHIFGDLPLTTCKHWR